MNVLPDQLALSFENDDLGDPQEFRLYNESKSMWLVITLTTQTRAPRKIGFGLVKLPEPT